jgi:hypothetical protein
MQSKLMKTIVSAEYLFAAVLVGIFFVAVGGFDWWWLVVLFLAFDVSMAGYLVNNTVGAFTYNLGHSLIGPGLVATYFVMTSSEAALFVALLWLFHVFVDRTLGFGLKHAKGFHHTHLGKIGKK